MLAAGNGSNRYDIGKNLGKVAMTQLAHFYNLPIYGLGGGVEGKVPDSEAASEAMMSKP